MTSRVAPAAASMAFPTFKDFGKPEPYIHAIVSRISNPASSSPDASRW